MNMREEIKKMSLAAPGLAASSIDQRNKALEIIAELLSERKEEVFNANTIDMENAAKAGLAASIMKRLKYDEVKMRDSIAGLKQLSELPDPLGKQLLKRQLDEGLILTKLSVPIGVIGVIFEARPDAMIQVASLCIKSGNCAVLKGGKETAATNKVLFEIIRESVEKAGLPGESLLQAELHNEIDELLECDEEVDLIIPRGSNSFVRYIMEHTKIPVMGHSSGICHIYADDEMDEELALKVITDAKIQYPAACNAVETVLINRKIAKEFLPRLAARLREVGVTLRGTKECRDILEASIPEAAQGMEVMNEDDFATEYNDLIISLKLVDDVDEAISHINRFGSHHTDSIITTDDRKAERFMQMVDSAGVYRNVSTRFADGFRYGFGAEVGISTGKLHARGPVGLDGLVTYKYTLTGNGQIVAEYASGEKIFKHKDLI
ncbi:glutamate-5-semialdehyde dehydrogenase [Butyrivibrio sp. MC2013]|uniref:glutamate-5-semialdehyde dehydrogenase n=1 Tax=Butyrivibrio sp. MC2013 TaxID=1280686 RepID=UPI0004246A37|nr:glutamate-5-semialdehyde dehydrogenase [Butyrivibrio sp. MC2013]